MLLTLKVKAIDFINFYKVLCFNFDFVGCFPPIFRENRGSVILAGTQNDTFYSLLSIINDTL